MHPGRIGLTVTALVVLLAFSSDAFADRRVRTYQGKTSEAKQAAASKPNQTKLKSFEDMTKDRVKIEGLFTFYRDTTDNSLLMSIKPEHFGPYYLCGMARAAGDGTYYDTGPIGRSFPFYFKKVGKKIQMMEKNLRLRADSTSTLSRAVEKSISDHLFGAVDIKSKPDDSGAVLIDPTPFFVRDAENTSYYLGQRAKLGVAFDSKNSYFDAIKSFPENSEIDVMLHFKSGRPISGPTLQNGQSFFHRYHFSLSSLPETDYVPRLSDDRVGYFVTQYEDYTVLNTESAFVRYIQRWNLKKKNPEARISDPVEPVVFWIENTVPLEYRDAVAEGIEFWNESFEKLGYRNAVIARQMPDTADWDPLDVRFNTVRWMVSTGVYAIGPSRANPFTGQIYDADISLSVDFIRAMFNTMENFIAPITYDGRILEDPEQIELNPTDVHDDSRCTYARELAEHAAFDIAYLQSLPGDLAGKDSLTKEYVHSYLVELIAHEVGHTLGFRHNFKASSIYTLEQLQDRDFTRKNGTIGSIMDYAPANLAPTGQPQGEFFASVPGPYDNWRVEYGYKDFGAEKPEDEIEQLKEIASRSAEPELAYATDWDASVYSVDPLTNAFDLGNDPIAYCEHKLKLTQELWNNAINEFEKPGVSYEKIRRVFQSGWRSYFESARFPPRYIGGLYHNKNYIGDPGGDIPFKPVPASEQRRAIAFLRDNIFAPDAFTLPPDLLNKLQPARAGDFSGRIYGSRLDYPWHQYVLYVQRSALNTLYSPITVGRLLNNLARYKPGDDIYTMHDMFTDVRRAIWGEIVGPSNVNSQRRQLQLNHLGRITAIYLSSSAVYPSDARTLAANDLDILEKAAQKAAEATTIDDMSRAHFKEVLRQIEAAKGAKRDFSRIGR